MLVLGLTTAESPGAAALLWEGRVVAEAVLRHPRSEGSGLVPLLAGLCRAARRRPEVVQLFAVVTGPGSHTGLRIGAMAAGTLAWVFRRPVVGIPTLAVLLAQADRLPAAPLLDAGPRGVYGGLWDGKRWLLPPALRAPERLARELPPEALVLGSGRARLPRPDTWPAPPPDRLRLQAATVARLGWERRSEAGPPAALALTYFPAAGTGD